MAHVLRVGLSRFASQGCCERLCKVSQSYNVLSVAFIRSKANRIDLPPKPKPFPYWHKKISVWNETFDPLFYRLDENSKIITVEGSLAMGKGEFCKELAEKLDMLYMPAPTMDDFYVNVYGDDLRRLDAELPPGAQSCDVKKFLMNPHDENVPSFQLRFFQMRFEQYLNAILHMLSTGQGVVLNRCPFSDHVFMRLLYKSGYVRKEVLKGYLDLATYTLKVVPRPHLVIYLEAPVDVVQEKIKKRNIDYEVQSKVLTREYLSLLDNIYKQNFLDKINSWAHVLVYDWSTKSDVDWIVHDIEQLDFTCHKEKDRFGDWVFSVPSHVHSLRTLCQDKFEFMNRILAKYEDLPSEFSMTAHEGQVQQEVYEKVLSEKYGYGYNPYFEKTDKILWQKDIIVTGPLARRQVRDFIYRDPNMGK